MRDGAIHPACVQEEDRRRPRDSFERVTAQRIIDLAKTHERNPGVLCERALRANDLRRPHMPLHFTELAAPEVENARVV